VTSPIVSKGPAAAVDERGGRVATLQGERSYRTGQDTGSGFLVDDHGRPIVRIANAGGYEIASTFSAYGEQQETGSAANKENLGLVQSSRVLRSAFSYDNTTLLGASTTVRMFGYAVAAGFVQLIMTNEPNHLAPNPPVGGEVPEVTIAVAAGQNYTFSNYLIGPGNQNAVYIAFSTTGPTYTPGGVNLWFYHLGFV